MLSIRSMSTKASNLLIAPHVENRVVVNFWSPGYKIKETVKDRDGKERKIQRFYPTTTTEADLHLIFRTPTFMKPMPFSHTLQDMNILSLNNDVGDCKIPQYIQKY